MDKLLDTENLPLVSVIMLSFNSIATIEDAVNCIINQSYSNWELIISDGASTDGTREWLQQLNHPQIRTVLNTERHGYIRDKNSAFRYAKGELITQLDSDDLCPDNRLELQAGAFIRNPDVRIVGGNFRLMDMEGNILKGSEDFEEDFMIPEVLDKYPFWYACLMAHKDLFIEFGYFSEYFVGIYGDDDYWTSKVNMKYPIYFVKEPIYYYRANHNSVTHIFDNPRKLIVTNIILELKRQMRERGSDWIAEGREDLMKEFEKTILADKKIMGEKYRIWAARAIDKKDFSQATFMLKKAISLNPFNRLMLNTAWYYIKSRL